MASADSNQAHRCLAVVGVAYLAQGIVAGVGVLLLGILAQRGTPLETQVGLLASGALPWLLKFGLAMVIDLGPSWPLRVRGLALSVLGGGAALCLAALARAWPAVAADQSEAVVHLGMIWVALNMFAAIQDVIVDGLALDTLAGRPAWVGALMGLGHALGAGLLGPLIISRRIVDAGVAAGLELPLIWIAALALAPALLLWPPGRPPRARASAKDVAARPRQLGVLAWLPALYVALLFGANATQAVGFEFLFGHLQWDLVRYSERLLPLAAAVGLLGTLACGLLVARVGPGRAAIAASASLGAVWLGFAALAPWWTHDGVILGLAAVEGVAQAGLLVALHALALVFAARSPAPTTTFVLAMAALNLPRVLAPLAAPGLMVLGFAGLFAVCGLVQLLACAGLWPLRAGVPNNTPLEQPQSSKIRRPST